jgi:hypothetical protein
MPQKTRTAKGSETLEVFAGAGYFSGKKIVACEIDGITPNVPKSQTSNSKDQARYGKQDFSTLLGKMSTFIPQVSD